MKLKLLLLLCWFWSGTYAQESNRKTGHINKGHFVLGINSNGLGFIKSNNKTSTDRSISYTSSELFLRLDAGYFIYNHLQFSICTNLNLVKNNSIAAINHFGIGPKINYYFKSASNLLPFAAVSGEYFNDNSHFFEKEGYSWEIGGGISFFLNNCIAIQTMLQYQNKTFNINFQDRPYYDDSGFYKKSNINTSQLNFNIGFSVFF